MTNADGQLYTLAAPGIPGSAPVWAEINDEVHEARERLRLDRPKVRQRDDDHDQLPPNGYGLTERTL